MLGHDLRNPLAAISAGARILQRSGALQQHKDLRVLDMQAVIIASAGLLLTAAIPLGRDGLTGPVTVGIALVSFVLLLTTKLDTLWIIFRRGLSVALSLITGLPLPMNGHPQSRSACLKGANNGKSFRPHHVCKPAFCARGNRN